MVSVEGYIDSIFFVDAVLSPPKISGSTLVICAKNIGVVRGHPLYRPTVSGAPLYIQSSHLVFEGVIRSVRDMDKYLGNPVEGKFLPPEIVSDGPFPSAVAKVKQFRFEGTLEYPFAWVDWKVDAERFFLKVL
jgi:hypothetical protein